LCRVCKMKTSELDYQLPEELIAQDPIEKRDNSRLMLVHRETGKIEHKTFKDLLQFLKPDDLLVRNDTRVIPARLFGKKIKTGGKVEALLLKKYSSDIWECLLKSSGHINQGTQILFDDNLDGTILELFPDGRKIIKFSSSDQVENRIEKIGVIPLPPYIHHPLKDPERYQTIYSKYKGAVASPTAGLHFSEELMSEITRRGIQVENVTLHISLDTFRPIKVETIHEHKLFSEYCVVKPETAVAITKAKRDGRRIVAVGTTTTRVLESVSELTPDGPVVHAFDGWADLFITPGYEFKIVDMLITNFHLPRSTLILLVGAFSGLDLIKHAYQVAIENKYRFYSFGDVMLII